MIKNSLVSKMIVVFTAIISITFIMMAAFLSMWFESYYLNERKYQLDKVGSSIATSATNYLYEKQESSLTKLQRELALTSNALGTNILLADSYGYIYAVSSEDYKNLLFTTLPIKEMDELRFGSTIEKKGNFFEPFNSPSYVYLKPIFKDNKFSGVIFMQTPLKLIKEPLRRVYSIIWICALLAVVTASIFIYYFAQKILIGPLAHINNVAKRISKGEVNKRVLIESQDEIGELSKSFNIMADSIEEVENTRREFISNVSHEIRSPLTSIKGFIGGILDGVIPKDKENHYLQIAFEEVKRLSRLINDLLDLSAMESGKLKLTMSEIDINELIRICVIKFEQRINNKHLKVNVTLEEDHMYVLGDRDRLIQVITNILDNAIKYSGDSGNISIKTKGKGGKVLVHIYNDGPIISREHIGHIWERFYKDDKSRTSKISTGLGLPIVRNILTQLGGDIWVENKGKETGVLFTFSLKKV